MEKRVLKFKVEPILVQKIEMPTGSKILCAATQLHNKEEMFVWALCPDVTEKEQKEITICPTGQGATNIDAGNYIGTVFFRHTPDPLVFHVFETSKL